MLSIDIDVEVIEEAHVPNPIAKSMLEKYLKELQAAGLPASVLAHETLEHLRKFSKMSSEEAEELLNELNSFNLRNESKVMIVNICPQTIEELRALLVLEDKVFDTNELESILSIISKYCPK
ncbi:MAG: DNA-directed RNA polymerase subunit F [Desulfurococcaceae archaeon]